MGAAVRYECGDNPQPELRTKAIDLYRPVAWNPELYQVGIGGWREVRSLDVPQVESVEPKMVYSHVFDDCFAFIHDLRCTSF